MVLIHMTVQSLWRDLACSCTTDRQISRAAAENRKPRQGPATTEIHMDCAMLLSRLAWPQQAYVLRSGAVVDWHKLGHPKKLARDQVGP